MGSLADLTLGDIGRALARYRPVAVTIGIILAVIVALPGPTFDDLGSVAGLQGPVQVPQAPAGTPPTTAAPPGATDTGTSTFGGSSSSFDSSAGTSSSASSFDSSSGSFSSTVPSSSSSSSFGSDDDSSDDGTTDPTDATGSGSFESDEDPSSSDAQRAEPLSVVASAWASRTGGTPVGATGVPAGLLPVGKRIGQRDKLSFIRLSGDETSLVLNVDAATSRTTTGETAVSACQITTPGWPEATNQTFEQAPKFDEKSCVVASLDVIGRYVFDLTLFPDRSDERGFALVPTGPSVDYQLNFRTE